MIKMVVSSFYNALLDEEEAIPTSTMLEIERIRKKGVSFTVCTNRLYTEVLEYNKDFPFLDYIISLNGSYIYDVGKESFLVKNKLSLPNIKKIQAIFPNSQLTYYTENNSYQDLSMVKEQEVYKIEIEIDKDITEELEKLKKLNINTSTFIYNNKKYLEITSSRSSMFSGVDKVSIKLNISLNEVIAIGANESDEALIRAIPKSYVVKNCCPLLRKTDAKKTSSNTEKGVEKILKKL